MQVMIRLDQRPIQCTCPIIPKGEGTENRFEVVRVYHEMPVQKGEIYFLLKVGSCPNNDKSVQFSSVLFCVAFK